MDDRGSIPGGVRNVISSSPPSDWFRSPPSLLSNDIGAIFPGVKRPELEADHSLLSSAKAKNAWRCTSIPPCVFMAWFLVKHKDSFLHSEY